MIHISILDRIFIFYEDLKWISLLNVYCMHTEFIKNRQVSTLLMDYIVGFWGHYYMVLDANDAQLMLHHQFICLYSSSAIIIIIIIIPIINLQSSIIIIHHHHRSLVYTGTDFSLVCGSNLTEPLSLPLHDFLSEGWFSDSALGSSMPITSVQVNLGRPRPRHSVGLSFWTFFSQPSLRSTWPCHIRRRVRSSLPNRQSVSSPGFCELTSSFLVTHSHIHIFSGQCVAAMQIISSLGPGFACMERRAPGARMINLSSGNEKKWAGDDHREEFIEFALWNTASRDGNEFTTSIRG